MVRCVEQANRRSIIGPLPSHFLVLTVFDGEEDLRALKLAKHALEFSMSEYLAVAKQCKCYNEVFLRIQSLQSRLLVHAVNLTT